MAHRILYIDHTAKMGGGEIALANLVERLARSRFEPVVLLFQGGALESRLLSAGVETHVLLLNPRLSDARKDSLGVFSLARPGNLLRALAFVYRLGRFIRAANVDLIHTNSLKADLLGGLAGRLVCKPVIWHVRDRIDGDYLPPRVAKIFRWLSSVLPTAVIANSYATMRTLDGRSGVKRPGETIDIRNESDSENSDRRWVVHEGVGTEHLTADFGRESTDCSVHPPRIGLVGRITRWKGQHIFIHVAALVRKNFPTAKFLIVGSAMFSEDDYNVEIHDLVGRLGLEDVVEFTGFCNNVPQRMAGLDLLVHASITGEPFGQVIIEGMAAGKPVVATAGGGVPEIVVDGVTGTLVPMDDVQAMSLAIEAMLENPQRSQEMGRAGRQRVVDHFTIEHTARKVEAIYDHLLNRSSKSGSSVAPAKCAMAESS